MENIPEQQTRIKKESDGLLNGPQLNTAGVGVVASQEQVDDLLDSLGFWCPVRRLITIECLIRTLFS